MVLINKNLQEKNLTPTPHVDASFDRGFPVLSQSAKVAAKGPVKKKRAKKDKNAPKGAMSAFMQFSQKERPLVSPIYQHQKGK